MAHFLPCIKVITSEEIVKVVMREVFRHHGLPDSIISDCGPQFVSKFWKHLLKMLKVTCNISSGYHPQTDGEAERTNQTLEQYLRCFLSYQQDDWADILHFAEFAYNNSIHSSTRVTPFYAYTGYHPRWCVLATTELPTNPRAEDHLEWLRKIQADISTHYINLNKHRMLMRIIIGFHLALTLEIGYGYYDDISRLLDHAIKSVSRSEVEGSRILLLDSFHSCGN